MDGLTSVTMNGILHRIVLDGCVVDLSLLHLSGALLRIVAQEFNKSAKMCLPVLHLMYVHIGFGMQPFLGQHLLDCSWGGSRVLGPNTW